PPVTISPRPGEPLGLAGRQAIELGRAAGASISLDLASIGPLLARGRRAAPCLDPGSAPDTPVDLASIAVVKRGSQGATVLAREGDQHLRFEVATTPMPATDTTGAGDAFDA